jgi:hypothetical protein
VHSFFVWLESSAFSVWVRDTPSVFAFPAILSLHTIGMGIVAGLNFAIALRILGVAPHVPVTETHRFFPLIWFGFWLNAVSGVMLLIAYPTKAFTNPVFYTKLTLVAVGLVLQTTIRNRILRDASLDIGPVPRAGKILAVASLVCWASVITTGRLLAYTYTRLMSI